MNIVQIGCNNCEDEVFKFVSDNKDSVSKFLVIDALPECVEIAKIKYAFLEHKLVPANCAIYNDNTIVKLVYPESGGTSAHASVFENHVKMHGHSKCNFLFLPSLTLNNIFEFMKGQVDRLYIDIEGYDVEALLKLNYEKYKPKYIEYEWVHSDGVFTSNLNHNKLVDLLTKNNYKVEKQGYNSIAQLQ